LTAMKKAGAETSVIIIGSNASQLVKDLTGWGVKTAFICENEMLKNYNSELYTKIIADLITAEKPQLALASASMLAKDVFPRVAARTGSGFANDAVEINCSGSEVSVRKPMYAGKCTAKVSFQNTDTAIVLMRANQLTIETATAADSPEIKQLPLPQ